MTMINAVTLSLKSINDDDESKTVYISRRERAAFLTRVLDYLWVLGMELPSCHPFGD